MNSEGTNWLLRGPAWIQYRTQSDLLDINPESEKVHAYRASILAKSTIQNLVYDCIS
jgi:hypothetical protein